MQKIIEQGRWIFGVAMAGLGAENLICARMAETKVSSVPHVPVLPWVPAHPWMAFAVGIVMLAAGLCIAAKWKVQPAAFLLGILLICFAVFLEAPRAAVRPMSISLQTISFEPLALGAVALVMGGTMKGEQRDVAVATLGRWIFGISLVVFGVDHFLVVGVIAELVPTWMPWKMFWAYLTGAGFVAAGVCIATKWMGRWAGLMLGVMFLLWFVLLHAPRTLGLYAVGGGPRNPNEWSSLLIAVGMWGSGRI